MYSRQTTRYSEATRGPYQRPPKRTKFTSVKGRSGTVAKAQQPELFGASNSDEQAATKGCIPSEATTMLQRKGLCSGQTKNTI